MYKRLLLGSVGLGLLQMQWSWQQRIQCCGIIGVLTTEENAEQIVFEAVQLLQNRGYDSAGIGTISREHELVISKYASNPITKVDCFNRLQQELIKHKQSIVGIGHTRWATCGSKTDKNAHPHNDQLNRISLVHNGTLENYVELRNELLQQGVTFSSETDTEVIAQMIGHQLRSGSTLLNSVELILEKLQGQWGLVIIDKENPEDMIVCRQGSPILVGYNQNSIFVASEKIAFEKYTQNYIQLQDGEVMQLSLKNRTTMFNSIKHRIIFNDHMDAEQIHLKPKSPFNTFFEMEIHEQPNSILRCLGNGGRLAGLPDCSKLGGLELKETEICQCRHLLLIGSGSSLNAAYSTLAIYRGFRMFDSVQVIEASEFQLHDLPLTTTAAILISQSGETKDLVKVLQILKTQSVLTIGIVNVVGSLIASTVDCGVYVNCGREVAVAATKSFTSQVVGLTLVALWMSYHKEKHNATQQQYKQLRELHINQLRLLPIMFGQAIHQCLPSVKLAAKLIQQQQNIIIIGKGAGYAMAREGALKIKELSYKHAEAFCAGELKHGPLALIDSSQEKSTVVILIILNNEYNNDMKLALSEIHSRNALTIVISDDKQCIANVSDKIDHLILIPHIGEQLSWLLSVVAFQLLTLELCTLLGTDIDRPRNLAKTVTVG